MQIAELVQDDDAPVALVVNAAARRGAAALELTRSRLEAAGVRSLTTYAAGSGAEVLAALDLALAERPRLLVVGGGDGTVGCAAARVAGTGTVLGVVPLGTANDFARTLELPPDPAAAVTALLGGVVADVDLGRAGDRAFLNVASLGMSVGGDRTAHPGAQAPARPARLPGRDAPRLPPPRAVPGPPHLPRRRPPDPRARRPAPGRGRQRPALRRRQLGRPERLHRRRALDVYAIERGRLRDHVSIARFLKDGSFVEHEKVTHLTTQRVVVDTVEPLPVNLDGEIATATPLEFRVDRNALRVGIPAHSRAARLDAA